jgi:hypothetical protein
LGCFHFTHFVQNDRLALTILKPRKQFCSVNYMPNVKKQVCLLRILKSVCVLI